MTSTLQESLQNIPPKPGVYQYFDTKGDLLYVGKAKNLLKRVNSYWSNRGQSPWTQLLVQDVASIKTIEVKTEFEAFLLENSLIKSLKPKYNLQLKDDKTFPFVRISADTFPTFTIIRRVKKDKARYLGPYFSSSYLRIILKLAQELYGIKTAKETSYEARSSVPGEIGLGARNLDNQDIYNNSVDLAIKFLTSPQPQLEKKLHATMESAAKSQSFEIAARLRDKIISLEQLRNAQSLFSPSGINRDYVGIVQTGKLISAYVLFEREGMIKNHKHFLFEYANELAPSALAQLVINYLYIQGLTIPKEIVVSTLPDGDDELIQVIQTQAGYKVTFVVPQRGDSKKRLATATENAHYQIHLESIRKNRRENGLIDLAQTLSLPKIPKRIEAFDISNLGATNIVGASIVFIDGKPAKDEYRKYKINTPQGQDDFASMRELVFRRITNKQRPLPDLLLIDGGKGQLSSALAAMKLAKLDLQIVSLAKKEELLYVPNREDPIALAHDSDALLLLTAIRDEVHRFVIGFHRQRRKKSLLG